VEKSHDNMARASLGMVATPQPERLRPWGWHPGSAKATRRPILGNALRKAPWLGAARL